MTPALALPTFIARWQGATLSERSAAQSHFIQLCEVLGQPQPTAADQTGSFYTFEKGVAKSGGGKGFADVWMRGHFAWEYKGKHKNLDAAYQQLLKYREDLENPPLLVVCDLNRFEVHTNYTGTAKQVYRFDLADLARAGATEVSTVPPLDVLRLLFTDPARLRPQQTTAQVTEAAAAEFSKLAERLRTQGVEASSAAHFLMRLLFCLFAEDIGLLPDKLFTKLVERTRTRPEEFGRRLRQLFEAMASGGSFGSDDIPYFNGGLFANDQVLELSSIDLTMLLRGAQLDWASIEPAIFGTLFERSLDPAKRAQLGAHYTSRDDIMLIVEPVLMAPLRREWGRIQENAQPIIANLKAARGAQQTRYQRDLERLLIGFSTKIAGVRVLDPACGSGNFLYVALKQLLDLEKQVIAFGATSGSSYFFPQVGPHQLHGIELNEYAHELAQMVIWIGYIQWLHDNGFGIPEDPILKPLHNILYMDAILTHDEAGRLIEPAWPEADVIIGNPPFLGGKRLRAELGDGYVDDLFALYRERVPREADLVCYFFERARASVTGNRRHRAGLLATQGIRGGANRKILERIKETGDIFVAWSDRPWVLDGATVHVSMIGFDAGEQRDHALNGVPVPAINADLTGALDVTMARPLTTNRGIAFMGSTKGGPFDLTGAAAALMLATPLNPNGRPNSDVIRPWINGLDIMRRPRGMWIVDFGSARSEENAALYEAPFAYVEECVKPARAASRTTRPEWWLFERPRPEMRAALAPLSRYIATPLVSKHRAFVWVPVHVVPENLVIVFAREDDYFMGVLHSRVHELWARSTGTQLREAESGSRYTATSIFETFPCPWSPGQEPMGDPRVTAVAAAACHLVTLRDRWLNPPDASEATLRQRTLTNLYNDRPAWLANAHRQLDDAVLDAYGWPRDLSDEDILSHLLALNLARASGLASGMLAGMADA